MRADRLLATLLLLQARGRVTAAEVAEELEVSERTARRDLEALAMAGVPVYSRQGRNGGWELVGGARTDLSGLTAAEARALFLVAGPASSATPQVKAALRKLLQALPEPFRTDAAAASAAVIVDPSWWGHQGEERPPPAYLDVLQQAVIEGRQVVLGYVARDRAETTRVVHPLGLASKSRVWYLVGDTDAGLRTFRVDRVQSVELTDDPVVRPDGFDLGEAWKLITASVVADRPSVSARGTTSAEHLPLLRVVLGSRLRVGPPTAEGRIEVEVEGHDVHALAGHLAGFGAMLELRDPPAVVAQLARVGRELTALYGDVGEPT